jgi:ribosomal protein S18 acetylase RimI-like enzyme
VIHSLARPANLEDYQKLSSLIFLETHLHRHLDWRSPLEWLGDPFFWALEDGRQISAALACPIEVDGIAWLRLFVFAGGWSAENAWNVLWPAARESVARAGGARVAVIAMQAWFQRILTESGFENPQRIVMLEWHGPASQPWPFGSKLPGVQIRRMTEADLPVVHDVDAASFDPIWQNSFETLRRAFSQSLLATVAETEAGIVGYQLSTGSGQRAHLARLAVQPSLQGRGVGRGLVQELFSSLVHNGIYRLSVNTQSDNMVSLRLYQRMGFVRTGEQYPVYLYDVPAGREP